MRKVGVLFFCLVAAQATAQITPGSFDVFVQSKEQLRKSCWEKKDYVQAVSVMKEVYREYFRQNDSIQSSNNGVFTNLCYNLACAYSLSLQKDSAFAYLQLALDHGYKNYRWAIKDSDFDNIRNEERIKEIMAKLKEVGDYKVLLRKNANYDTTTFILPAFTYQPSSELRDLRLKYALDSVAGSGDEMSRIIRLMQWVHRAVRHDGNSTNPSEKNADALLTICKKEGRGINCRMMATILNEVYLAMGFPSRFVTCMPQGEIFDDCHVINIVYSKDLKKWIWMDPTFETYVQDDTGHYLNIEEVRQRLIEQKPLKLGGNLNWNGNPYDGGEEQYLHVYMAKNLFRFSCPTQSLEGFESKKGKRLYIDLYPVGYNPTNVTLGTEQSGRYSTTIYVTNSQQFWVSPR
jgi:hypothetical protein